MNQTIMAIALAVAIVPAAAATCTDEAKDKKLSGAAMNSFMKKCEAEAKSSCEATSKKCEAERVGGK